MANQKQVGLLKKGFSSWNKWRKKTPIKKINLSGFDFSGIDLTGFDLSSADLNGTNLSRANLEKIDLNGANLSGAKLARAVLYEANLSGADFSKANLSGANLFGANLRGTDFNGAYLHGANLCGADLSAADLSKANLSNADFNGANLSGANLSDANLSIARLNLANLIRADLRRAILNEAVLFEVDLTEADLTRANLSRADLSGANLSGADLSGADLSQVHLKNANLSRVTLGNTVLGNIDFSETLGLEQVRHTFPSTLGTNTMYLSKGKIPEIFLRGCGLSDWEIEAAKLYDSTFGNHELVTILYNVVDIRSSQPIQISPVFISYSHVDNEFVDTLEKYLNRKGIRFWRDIHNVTSGRLEKQIDRAIRLNSTVLLVLSKNSIKSDWVEHEVRLARELEKETQRDVLCPIALDDSWKTSPWPKRIMEQVMEYNILDFSKWNDDNYFKNIFVKLIDGLNLYYKKPEG